MVKMQVFELLAALSLFSPQGYHLALDALDYYKVRPLFCLDALKIQRLLLSFNESLNLLG